MLERAILIHFDTATGETKIEAEGFEGLSCLEATLPFEEALGIVEQSDRTYKEEARVQHSTRITQTQNQQMRLG